MRQAPGRAARPPRQRCCCVPGPGSRCELCGRAPHARSNKWRRGAIKLTWLPGARGGRRARRGGGGAIAARRASCARGRATRVRRPCVQGASVYRVREGRTTLQALRPRQPAWTPSHKLRGGEVTTRKLVLCGWGCVVIRHPVYVAGGQRSKHPGHWHCCCASRARQRRASGGLRAPRNARTPPHPARRSRVSRVTPPPPLLPYWCGGSGGGLGGCACGAERGRDDMRLPPLRAPFCRSLPRHPSRPPPSSLRVC